MFGSTKGKALRRFVGEALALLGSAPLDALSRRATTRRELRDLEADEVGARIAQMGCVRIEQGMVVPNRRGRAGTFWTETRQRVDARSHDRWAVELLRRNPGGLPIQEISRLAIEEGRSVRGVEKALRRVAGVEAMRGHYRLLDDPTPVPLTRPKRTRNALGVTPLGDDRWRLCRTFHAGLLLSRPVRLAQTERILPEGLFHGEDDVRVRLKSGFMYLMGLQNRAEEWDVGDTIAFDFDLATAGLAIQRVRRADPLAFLYA